MAFSTYQTYLMHKGGTDASYSKLIDIKSFPDLGSDPETLETTTLSDAMQTFIPGIQGNDNMEFEANYTLENFKAVNALKEKEEDYAIWFGADSSSGSDVPDGNRGKFKFKGYAMARVAGGNVNEVVSMSVIITPSTPIELDESI